MIEIKESEIRNRNCGTEKEQLLIRFQYEKDSIRANLNNSYIELLKQHNQETEDALKEQKEINATIEKSIHRK